VFAAQFQPDGTDGAPDQLQRRTTTGKRGVVLRGVRRIDVRDEAEQVACPTLHASRDDHRVPVRFGESWPP
jgi:hypothetical protein